MRRAGAWSQQYPMRQMACNPRLYEHKELIPRWLPPYSLHIDECLLLKQDEREAVPSVRNFAGDGN